MDSTDCLQVSTSVAFLYPPELGWPAPQPGHNRLCGPADQAQAAGDL